MMGNDMFNEEQLAYAADTEAERERASLRVGSAGDRAGVAMSENQNEKGFPYDPNCYRCREKAGKPRAGTDRLCAHHKDEAILMLANENATLRDRVAELEAKLKELEAKPVSYSQAFDDWLASPSGRARDEFTVQHEALLALGREIAERRKA